MLGAAMTEVSLNIEITEIIFHTVKRFIYCKLSKKQTNGWGKFTLILSGISLIFPVFLIFFKK